MKLIGVIGLLLCLAVEAEEQSYGACTLKLEINGTIGPGSDDFLSRGYEAALKRQCSSILVLINTPGGSLQSTRSMVELILNSEIPFLCLVAPSGGHAGSAGAILLQACHVSGALSATNIGAATPILGTGGDTPKDLRNKMINDTKSWVRGLAELRGRNLKFSEEIVTKAKAVSAKEAFELKAIDHHSKSLGEFLKFSKTQKVQIKNQELQSVQVGTVMRFKQDLRYKALSLLTDPQTAYMMFMGSLGLLYFEITHPGAIVPGVIGGIGLVISLISLYNLQVEWAGLLLIVLGLAFLILEAFVPSFGFLGLGGVVAFVLGSLFLFDTESTGVRLPLYTILATALLLGGAMVGVAYMAFSSRSIKPHSGQEALIGKSVEVVELLPGSVSEGYVRVQGESWRFFCQDEVAPTQIVKIEGVEGLRLIVKKEV